MLLSPMEIVVVTVGTITVFIGDWHHDRSAPLLLALCAARITDRPADTCKKRCVSVVIRSPFVLRWLEARQQRVPNGPTAFLHAYSARAFLQDRDRSIRGYKKKMAGSLMRFISRWWMSIWKCLIDIGEMEDI